jgi:hypothetical protein
MVKLSDELSEFGMVNFKLSMTSIIMIVDTCRLDKIYLNERSRIPINDIDEHGRMPNG